MAGKVPRWEQDLWSSLRSCNGTHCPFRSQCHIRSGGKWCPDNYKSRLARLLDSEQFAVSDYNFVDCGTYGVTMGMIETLIPRWVIMRMSETLTQRWGIMRMLEMLTERYLKREGIDCPPVPTELALKIESRQPVEVHYVPLRVHHGATWYFNDETVIHIKDDDPPAEKRFTLFHELFHVLCQHKGVPVFRKTRPSQVIFTEFMANSFASFILMPRKLVEEKWAEVNDLDKITEMFEVPKSAMCMRLKWLNLL